MRRTRLFARALWAMAGMGFVLLASAQTSPRPANVHFILTKDSAYGLDL